MMAAARLLVSYLQVCLLDKNVLIICSPPTILHFAHGQVSLFLRALQTHRSYFEAFCSSSKTTRKTTAYATRLSLVRIHFPRDRLFESEKRRQSRNNGRWRHTGEPERQEAVRARFVIAFLSARLFLDWRICGYG